MNIFFPYLFLVDSLLINEGNCYTAAVNFLSSEQTKASFILPNVIRLSVCSFSRIVCGLFSSFFFDVFCDINPL